MSKDNYFDFEVEGGKELDKVLKSLPQAAAKQQLKASLRMAAKPVLRAARARAPRDTGAAAKSIKVRVMTRTNVPAAISIGPDLDHWYLQMIEFGTSTTAANPFLRQAWNSNRVAFVKTFGQNMWFVLERFSNRLLKQAYAGKLSNAGRKALGI